MKNSRPTEARHLRLHAVTHCTLWRAVRCDALYAQETGCFLLVSQRRTVLGCVSWPTSFRRHNVVRDVSLDSTRASMQSYGALHGNDVALIGSGWQVNVISTLNEAFWMSWLRSSCLYCARWLSGFVMLVIFVCLFLLNMFSARDSFMRFRNAYGALDSVCVYFGHFSRHLHLCPSSSSGGLWQRVLVHLVLYLIEFNLRPYG